MFGIGFTEILLISIIAILFLGPDKLPETMVQIAKFIKGVKKSVGDAKSALDEELRIADLKEEALSYKQKLDSATEELRSFKNIDLDDMNSLMEHTEPEEKRHTPSLSSSPYADEKPSVSIEARRDTVTFKKPQAKESEESNAQKETPQPPKTSDTTEGKQ